MSERSDPGANRVRATLGHAHIRPSTEQIRSLQLAELGVGSMAGWLHFPPTDPSHPPDPTNRPDDVWRTNKKGLIWGRPLVLEPARADLHIGVVGVNRDESTSVCELLHSGIE